MSEQENQSDNKNNINNNAMIDENANKNDMEIQQNNVNTQVIIENTMKQETNNTINNTINNNDSPQKQQMINEIDINLQQLQQLEQFQYNKQNYSQKSIATTTTQDTMNKQSQSDLTQKQPKRIQDANKYEQQLLLDFSQFNQSLKNKNNNNNINNMDSQLTQKTEIIPLKNNNSNNKQTNNINTTEDQLWIQGDQKFTKEDIKGCFSDKQIFNQANIFTRKQLDDLFEDSDEEVQEEGLVTQIHKRNMQDVYDMTPLDKKFTFLWNEFFIKLERNKMKEKIPIKRSDIYGYIQQFVEENTMDLLGLFNQFVIHLYTVQDNGIINSEQITKLLKYLKDYPKMQNYSYQFNNSQDDQN